MQGRTSAVVLAAASVAVLALAIGLFRWTHAEIEASPARSARRAPAPAAEPAPPVAAQPAPRVAAAAPRPAAPPPRERVTTRVAQPELAPAPLNLTRELKRDENGKLVPMLSLQQLRAELPRAAAAMQACVERAGRGVTGGATLTFTVIANRANKLVIDTTGIEDADSLAGYPDLLDCMHRTATALAVDSYPVPELGTAIYVRRRVRIESGALAEDSVPSFSYHP